MTDAAFQSKVKEAKIVVLEKGEAQKKQEELWKKVFQYWNHYFEQDFESVYPMYAQQYQEEVELAEFLKKKRFVVDDFEIQSATFWGDHCVQIRFRIDVSSESMVFSKLSLKHVWVYQNNEWRIYDNPFKANHMVAPKADPNAPCVFPADKSKD